MNGEINIRRMSTWTASFTAAGARIAVLILLLLLHGCGYRGSEPFTGTKYHPAAEEGVLIEPDEKGPGYALYSQARQLLAQGDAYQAELALERALRIEPGNPAYWYALGETKFKQDEYDQAIQFCLKSKSLAGKNARFIRMIDQLILKARRAGG